jgi:ADP-heptose:LPS heptosyltransferase
MEVSWLVNPVTCSLFDRPYTYLYSNEDASGGLAKFDPQNWQKFVDNLPDYDMVIDLRAHGCTRNLLSAWEWRGTICFSFGDGIYPDYNGANPQKLLHNGQALAAFLASIPLYKSMGTAKGKKIGICTSASSPVKRWPYWQNLVDRLCEAGLEVVQFAGPGNDKLTGCKVRQVPLNQIVRAIRNECSVYIGHDSGPTHLAASSGVPVISVVGGLVRPEEWQPIGDATTITCPTPCHGCYGQPCRIGDVRCLRWIPLEDVFREALRKAFY